MLALGLEQGRRGGSEAEHLQKDAAVARQSGPPARLSAPGQGINIREKILQWEGRGQDAGVNARPPTASRRMSGDVLGSVKLKAKVSLSKSLEFWEGPSQNQPSAVGRKSEPALKRFGDFTSAPAGNKPLTAQRFTPPKLEAGVANSTGAPALPVKADPKLDRTLGAEIASKPLPLPAEFQEDSMPAGNFYTSRGFWRKLEGDRLLWEKGRASLGEAPPPPPPKPLRTFQYRGADGSDAGSTRPAHPPTDPPPPRPTAKTNGLSRHKKNRWVATAVKKRTQRGLKHVTEKLKPVRVSLFFWEGRVLHLITGWRPAMMSHDLSRHCSLLSGCGPVPEQPRKFHGALVVSAAIKKKQKNPKR